MRSDFSLLILWAKMDSNHRSRKTADLQSAPFGHSGICPNGLSFERRCKGTTFFESASRFQYILQFIAYFLNLLLKSTILMAVIAHSSPLLPCIPPARSSACCMVSVVMRPKITGISPCVLSAAIPCVVPAHT